MKNLQKGSVGVVAVIIIALIVIGGGVYYFKNKTKMAVLPGCVSEEGYSTTTGQKCDGTAPANPQ